MKKLWTGLLAAFLAGAVCLSVAACGKGKDGNAGENDPTAAAVAFEGKEVTAEQWAAAIALLKKDDTEITINVAEVITTEGRAIDPDNGKEVIGTTRQTDTLDFARKGPNEYMKDTHTMEYSDGYKEIGILNGVSPEEIEEAIAEGEIPQEKEIYGEKTADGYFTYEQTADGVWEKKPGKVASQWYDEYMTEGFLRNQVEEGKSYENFADYVYSAEQKGYILKDYHPEAGSELRVIKFDENGRLIAATDVITLENEVIWTEDGSTTYKQVVTWFFTYEAEEIVLPTAA